MAMRVGQLIKGARATYQLLQPLKANTVFKARVVDSLDLHENWAVVKTSTGLDQILLAREYENYQIPDIATSPYIRQMYEAIGLPQEQSKTSISSALHPPCLILEWMDTDLWHLPSKSFRNDAELPKIVCRSVLSALEIFRKHGKTHTDINPNNILLSNIDGTAPEVKVCDLGILIDEGLTKKRLQSLPCRAPEVWKCSGVSHASDIWSVGVTLAHWLLGKPIFGASDKIVDGLTEAWCIAKIERLVGPVGEFTGPDEIGDEFDVAAHLKDLDAGPPIGKVIKVQPLRRELEQITDPTASPALLDFIDSLLIVDVKMRPTAEQSLQHLYLK